MFDIGGWEFLIVIVIAIIVVGPKDLPGAIRTVTSWIRRARELAREFQSGIDDLARETDMDNVKNEIQSGLGLDDITGTGNTIRDQIEHTIDPGGDIEKAFKDDESEVDGDFEDDGPFADNSFEEDEDLDGAGPNETDIVEDTISEPGDTAETATATATILDEDVSDRQEEISGHAVKKSES